MSSNRRQDFQRSLSPAQILGGGLPDSSSTTVSGSNGKRFNDSTESARSKQNTPIQSSRKGSSHIFKVIIIGDSSVGKTCLTFRFCGGTFSEKHEATIGVDFREKSINIEGETVKLQIWDTAGLERFRRSMGQHYYRNVHAVVFVYDITKLASFENLASWVDECGANGLGPNVPRLLVGNKLDLTEKRAVSTTAGRKFADFHGMRLFETSAKDDEETGKIEGIFLTIAHSLCHSEGYEFINSTKEESVNLDANDGNQRPSCRC